MKKEWTAPKIEKLLFAKTESGPFTGITEGAPSFTFYKTGS